MSAPKTYGRSKSTPSFVVPSKDMGRYEEVKTRRHSEPVKVLFQDNIETDHKIKSKEILQEKDGKITKRKSRSYSSYSVDGGCEIHGMSRFGRNSEKPGKKLSWSSARRQYVESWQKEAVRSVSLSDRDKFRRQISPTRTSMSPPKSRNISPVKENLPSYDQVISSPISIEESLSLGKIQLGGGKTKEKENLNIKTFNGNQRSKRPSILRRYKSFCTDISEALVEVSEEEDVDDIKKCQNRRSSQEQHQERIFLSSDPAPDYQGIDSWDMMGVLGLSSKLSRNTMDAKQIILNIKDVKKIEKRFSSRIEAERFSKELLGRKISHSTHAM